MYKILILFILSLSSSFLCHASPIRLAFSELLSLPRMTQQSHVDSIGMMGHRLIDDAVVIAAPALSHDDLKIMRSRISETLGRLPVSDIIIGATNRNITGVVYAHPSDSRPDIFEILIVAICPEAAESGGICAALMGKVSADTVESISQCSISLDANGLALSSLPATSLTPPPPDLCIIDISSR